MRLRRHAKLADADGNRRRLATISGHFAFAAIVALPPECILSLQRQSLAAYLSRQSASPASAALPRLCPSRRVAGAPSRRPERRDKRHLVRRGATIFKKEAAEVEK